MADPLTYWHQRIAALQPVTCRAVAERPVAVSCGWCLEVLAYRVWWRKGKQMKAYVKSIPPLVHSCGPELLQEIRRDVTPDVHLIRTMTNARLLLRCQRSSSQIGCGVFGPEDA
jgi:hypothetical protein